MLANRATRSNKVRDLSRGLIDESFNPIVNVPIYFVGVGRIIPANLLTRNLFCFRYDLRDSGRYAGCSGLGHFKRPLLASACCVFNLRFRCKRKDVIARASKAPAIGFGNFHCGGLS